MCSILYKDIKVKFDIIGDLAIIKNRDLSYEMLQEIGNLIIALSYARSVYSQVGPHSGLERKRAVKWVAGEKRTVTFHKENDYILKIDIDKVFFTPRLHAEHLRIGRIVKPGERVFNMFSGVGAFSISIALYSKPEVVISTDINEYAARLTLENARINNVSSVIEVIRSDAGFLSEGFNNTFDRILMPLPLLAKEYFIQAVKALKKEGWVHVYDMYRGRRKRDAIESAITDYKSLLKQLNFFDYYINARSIGSIAPRSYRIAIDIFIKK
ncbi:MAG: 50S ribosomal protein L11 methyltransferase [Thermoprotei archaeon]